MKDLVQTYTNTYKLAKNLEVTFTCQTAGDEMLAWEVEWDPRPPTSPIGRSAWKKYKAARECFAEYVSTKSGRVIHIVAQDDGGGDWQTIVVKGDI